MHVKVCTVCTIPRRELSVEGEEEGVTCVRSHKRHQEEHNQQHFVGCWELEKEETDEGEEMCVVASCSSSQNPSPRNKRNDIPEETQQQEHEKSKMLASAPPPPSPPATRTTAAASTAESLVQETPSPAPEALI